MGENDLKALNLGNAFAKFTIKLIRTLHQRKIPWMLENPWSSRVWDLPELKRIMAWDAVFYQRIDMRGYGTRWKKPTGLLSGHCNKFSLDCYLSNRCVGRRGTCSFTGKKRIILSGGAPEGGVPWTRIAQAYPVRLGNNISKVFCASCKPARSKS